MKPKDPYHNPPEDYYHKEKTNETIIGYTGIAMDYENSNVMLFENGNIMIFE